MSSPPPPAATLSIDHERPHIMYPSSAQAQHRSPTSGTSSGSMSGSGTVGHKPPAWHSLLAGALSGVASASFSTPFEVTKTRLAVQNRRYASLQQAQQQQPPKSQELLRRAVSSAGSSVASAASAAAKPSAGAASVLVGASPAAVSGSAAASPLLPRPLYTGVFGTLRAIWRAEGLPGLYRGFTPSLVGVPSFWMLYFTAYTEIKDVLSGWEVFQQPPAARPAKDPVATTEQLQDHEPLEHEEHELREHRHHLPHHRIYPGRLQHSAHHHDHATVPPPSAELLLPGNLGPEPLLASAGATASYGGAHPSHHNRGLYLMPGAGGSGTAGPLAALDSMTRSAWEVAQVLGHPGMWLRLDRQSLLHICSAASAGAIADTITNPIWVARTRLMTQHTGLTPGQVPPYRGVFGTLGKLWRTEGPASWLRGLSASLLGLSHVMIQFPLYERLKVALPAAQGETKPRVSDLILASCTSKIVASAVTYPHEVLRMRLQNTAATVGAAGGRLQEQAYRNILDCFRRTLAHEGPRALYQGFFANAVKTVPACALTFVTYEWVIDHLGRLQHDREHEEA